MERLSDWLGPHLNEQPVVLAIFSLALAGIGNLIRHFWADRKQRKSARMALVSEIHLNLTDLSSIRKELSNPGGRLDPPVAEFKLRSPFRLTKRARLNWKRSAWDSDPLRNAAALKPNEYAAVEQFYGDLNRLISLQSNIGEPWWSADHSWNFYDTSVSAWNSWNEIAQNLVDNGNPLIP